MVLDDARGRISGVRAFGFHPKMGGYPDPYNHLLSLHAMPRWVFIVFVGAMSIIACLLFWFIRGQQQVSLNVASRAIGRQLCHGSNQNRPPKVESKPASLRRLVHISFLDSCKRFSSEIKRAGSASASLSSRSLRSKVRWTWVGFSSVLFRPLTLGL